jgi:hypothetical protein
MRPKPLIPTLIGILPPVRVSGLRRDQVRKTPRVEQKMLGGE